MDIPPKPELYDIDHLIVTHKDILGALAKWAIRLSPYPFPNKLTAALCELNAALYEFEHFWPCIDSAPMSSMRLRTLIDITIANCKSIQEWSKPILNCDDGTYESNPDYECVSTSALARCMAQDIVKEWQIDKAQDSHRFREAELYGDTGDIAAKTEMMDVREIDYLSIPVVDPRLNIFIFDEPMLSLTPEEIAMARKEVGGITPSYAEDDPEYPDFPAGWETDNAPL